MSQTLRYWCGCVAMLFLLAGCGDKSPSTNAPFTKPPVSVLPEVPPVLPSDGAPVPQVKPKPEKPKTGQGDSALMLAISQGLLLSPSLKRPSGCAALVLNNISEAIMPDAALRAAVARQLAETPEVQAVQSLTTLDFGTATIVDLKGIECLPALRDIQNFQWIAVNDFTPLSKLTALSAVGLLDSDDEVDFSITESLWKALPKLSKVEIQLDASVVFNVQELIDLLPSQTTLTIYCGNSLRWMGQTP